MCRDWESVETAEIEDIDLKTRNFQRTSATHLFLNFLGIVDDFEEEFLKYFTFQNAHRRKS